MAGAPGTPRRSPRRHPGSGGRARGAPKAWGEGALCAEDPTLRRTPTLDSVAHAGAALDLPPASRGPRGAGRRGRGTGTAAMDSGAPERLRQ